MQRVRERESDTLIEEFPMYKSRSCAHGQPLLGQACFQRAGDTATHKGPVAVPRRPQETAPAGGSQSQADTLQNVQGTQREVLASGDEGGTGWGEDCDLKSVPSSWEEKNETVLLKIFVISKAEYRFKGLSLLSTSKIINLKLMKVFLIFIYKATRAERRPVSLFSFAPFESFNNNFNIP